MSEPPAGGAVGRDGGGEASATGAGRSRWLGEALLPPVRAALEEHFGHGADDGERVDVLAEVVNEVLDDLRCHGGGFARWLTRRLNAGAVAFGRRVYFSERSWQRYRAAGTAGVALAAHEATHVLQYRRDGLFRMLARYLWQYLRGRLRGWSHDRAYRAIDYEREAFAVEAEVRRRLDAAAGG